MPKINDTVDSPVVTPAADDLLIGTDVSDTAADPDGKTTNFSVGSIRTPSVSSQTGTAYTLVASDENSLVTMDNASANTLTIPTNAGVAFAIGSVVNIVQLGAGATTIAGDTGVTVNGVSAGSATLNAQYSTASIIKVATDTWVLAGDTGAVA